MIKTTVTFVSRVNKFDRLDKQQKEKPVESATVNPSDRSETGTSAG